MPSSSRRVFRRILVAVEPDTDPSCLDAADQIARAFDARLEALQVLPEDAAAAKILAATDGLAEQLAEDTGRRPEAFAASVRCGDAVGAILTEATESDADLLVVGTHERRGFAHWRSVGTILTRLASCSVLVSRSSSPTRGPVLVACDLGPGTQDVLATAGALARGLNESVVAIHAVEPNRHDLALIATSIFSGTVAPTPDGSAVDSYRTVADGALHAELSAALVDGRPEVCIGEAANAVIERARELRASLIVVGTHDRGGFARFVLGSVAEQIVRDAPCSVLVVRPRKPNVTTERSLQQRESLAAVAAEAVEGAVGAAAGAMAGVVAGPIGILAGGALGALAGVALGRKVESADHEAELHVRELDGIDAEREFFAEADEQPATRRYN